MTSIRLTNGMREKIVRNACKDKFTKQALDLQEREGILFEKLHKLRYNEEIRNFMCKFPEMFEKVSSVKINAGGYTIDLGNWHGNELYTLYDENKKKYFQVGFNDHGWNREWITLTFDKTEEELQEARSISELKEDLKVQYNNAKRLLSYMLSNVSTLSKLHEIWPEGLPFYKDISASFRINVPVVTIDEINSVFKLPKEEVVEEVGV